MSFLKLKIGHQVQVEYSCEVASILTDSEYQNLNSSENVDKDASAANSTGILPLQTRIYNAIR